MYHALLRISEVTHSDQNNHNLHLKELCLIKKGTRLQIRFSSYKHSSTTIPIQIKQTKSPFDSVTFYHKYLQVRGTKPDPAFVHREGTPLSRTYVKREIVSALQLLGIVHHITLTAFELEEQQTCIVKDIRILKSSQLEGGNLMLSKDTSNRHQ